MKPADTFECFSCATPWKSTLRQPAVKETCDRCGAYLHCCRNCRFHRKGYPNDCYIPDTEKIADKSRANFCDEFEFRSSGLADAENSTTTDPFSALWGEEPGSAPAKGAGIEEWLSEPVKKPKDLDDLFEN